MITYNGRVKEQGSSKDGNPYTLNELKAMKQGFTMCHDHKPNLYMYGACEGTALSEMMGYDELISKAAVENAELNRKYGARNATIMTRIMATENTMYDYYRGDVGEVKAHLNDTMDVWIDRISEFVDIERSHYLSKIPYKDHVKEPRVAQCEEDSAFRGLCL